MERSILCQKRWLNSDSDRYLEYNCIRDLELPWLEQ